MTNEEAKNMLSELEILLKNFIGDTYPYLKTKLSTMFLAISRDIPDDSNRNMNSDFHYEFTIEKDNGMTMGIHLESPKGKELYSEKLNTFFKQYDSNYTIDSRRRTNTWWITDISNMSINDAAEKMKRLIIDVEQYLSEQTENKSKQTEDKMENVNNLVKLLKANKNLILTGAPGTGKTHLAKQIAKEMIGATTDDALKNSGQYGFVQFHPSYDYTDFVEGLRPTKPDANKNIGFELKDGIFKKFCKNATEFAFDEAWNQIFKIKKLNVYLVERNIQLYAYVSDDGRVGFFNSYDDDENTWTPPIIKKNVKEWYRNYNDKTVNEFDRLTFDKIKSNLDIQYALILDYMREYCGLKETNALSEPTIESKVYPTPYIFIIDEINRGEISKIFGELFFSIDPGYRGKEGAVETQYQNMHDDPNEKFYVPENVYIIGTMNDIDRSVESFDFAMRRRFIWEEITAEKSAINMGFSEDSDTYKRMTKLNTAIENIEGLNSSYHIGGAYFIEKDKDGKSVPIIDLSDKTKRDNLWKLRLKPLLFEYLRGRPDEVERLKELEDAYNLEENKRKPDEPKKEQPAEQK